MEKQFDEFVRHVMSEKRRIACNISDGGCGSRHTGIDHAFLKAAVEEYVGDLYDSAQKSYTNKPRTVVKNHIVSKSVFGKGHYKVVEEEYPNPVIVSSASRHFTVDAKFGDVFEILCGYIEGLWGGRKNRFFNIRTHEIDSKLFRYMSHDYVELKMLISLIFAIHKVHSDYKEQYLTRETATAVMTDEFMLSFNAVSWFITAHPNRERIMNIPLIPRDITKFAYGKEHLEGLTLRLRITVLRRS